MFMFVKRVRDLNKFMDYLRNVHGLTLIEGSHAVLPDGSEVGTWCGAKDGKFVVCFASHYIDRHYDAMRRLPNDVDDSELLRALIEADRDLWRAPVEPVIVIGFEDWVARAVWSYEDEVPGESVEALKHFEDHGSSRELFKDIVSRVAYERSSVLRDLLMH